MRSRYTARQSHQVFRQPALNPVALSYCHTVLEESRGINGEKGFCPPEASPLMVFWSSVNISSFLLHLITKWPKPQRSRLLLSTEDKITGGKVETCPGHTAH